MLFAVLVAALASHSAHGCIDLRGSDTPVAVEGYLRRRLFAAPPNYDDVRKGDRAERTYILKLSRDLCIEDGGQFADPHERFRTVQVFTERDAVWPRLRAGRGHRVRIRGLAFAAHTAHHHAPMVVNATEIEIEKPQSYVRR